jgi:Rrf2 family protein
MRRLVDLSDGERLFAGDIARSIGASESYLAKILQALTKADLLGSERGVRGGYALARPAEEVTVCDVVEAVEGSDEEPMCLFSTHSAQQCSTCPVRCVLAEARGRLMQELDHVTIDMLPSCGDGWEVPVPATPNEITETLAGETVHAK